MCFKLCGYSESEVVFWRVQSDLIKRLKSLVLCVYMKEKNEVQHESVFLY